MSGPYGVFQAQNRQFVSGAGVTGSVGWTTNINSGTGPAYASRAAVASTAALAIIPFNPYRRVDETTTGGIKLTAAKIMTRIATADLVSTPTITLYRGNWDAVSNGTPTNATASTIAITHNATKTSNAADRLITVTITTPFWDYPVKNNISYWLLLSLNCATTSAVRLYGAFWDYVNLT